MKHSLLGSSVSLVVALCLLAAPAGAVTGTWNENPANGDWNLADNWSSMAVPNGSTDVAAFGLSSVTNIFLSANTEVASIVFNPGASAYTITATPTRTLRVSGVGLVNNSAVLQTFVAGVDRTGGVGVIDLTQNASAGIATVLRSAGSSGDGFQGGLITFRHRSSASAASVIADGSASAGFGGRVQFFDDASGGQASLMTNGAVISGGGAGTIQFFDRSTADRASIRVNGAFVGGSAESGGRLTFYDSASAAHAEITNDAGRPDGNGGGITFFENTATAGEARIVNNGSIGERSFYGATIFFDNATAGSSVIVNHGGTWGYTTGGKTGFSGNSTAGAATLIANGGPAGSTTGGSEISFAGNSTGGTARIQVFGNAFLNIRQHFASGVTIGSLEGTGLAYLGDRNLSIGSNNLSTEFSGVIQDAGPFSSGPLGGSITKIGSGTLVLSGQNTYSGLTSVDAGNLIINGSVETRVVVNDGTLGGTGRVGGVTVNSSGTLSPGASTGILHVAGEVTLALGANYLVELNGTGSGTQYDQLAVAGGISLGGATLALVLGYQPEVGDMFTLIDNDSTDVISGIFNGLPEGAQFVTGGHTFSISYRSGTGNDVVLTTVVPEPAPLALLLSGGVLIGIRIYRRSRSYVATVA